MYNSRLSSAFDQLDRIWEEAWNREKQSKSLQLYQDQATNAKVGTDAVINGHLVTLETPFMSPEEFMNKIPPNTPGIYIIQYRNPGHEFPAYYVGKSVDMRMRTRVHFIHCPERDSRLLHNKIRAHYETHKDWFKIAVLSFTTRQTLPNLERMYIKQLQVYSRKDQGIGLNLTRGGDGGRGGKVSAQLYSKIIKALRETEASISDIARATECDQNIIDQINQGIHWRSMQSDYEHDPEGCPIPIRSEEERRRIGSNNQRHLIGKLWRVIQRVTHANSNITQTVLGEAKTKIDAFLAFVLPTQKALGTDQGAILKTLGTFKKGGGSATFRAADESIRKYIPIAVPTETAQVSWETIFGEPDSIK